MMKDKMIFLGEENYQKVFHDIKLIAKCPTLSAFDSSLKVETILTTDASQYGLGAMFSKVSNGVEQPIIFVSRTLCYAEKNYSMIEKETLAVGYATTTYIRMGQEIHRMNWPQTFYQYPDYKRLC